MISLKKRFLFIHIPKTAGNSIQGILREHSEDQIVTHGNQDGIERFEVKSSIGSLTKHSTLSDYVAQLGQETVTNLHKFACVRNPWDRMISYYFSPHRRETRWCARRFRKFVEKEVKPLKSYFTTGHEAPGGSPFDNVDFIIRYEHLNEDFKVVCDRLEIPFTRLPVRNRSNRRNAADYYTPELRKLIARQFADEISQFSFEEPELK